MVRGDGTKSRIGGENGVHGVSVPPTALVSRISPNRGQEVAREVLDGFEGTRVRPTWEGWSVGSPGQEDLVRGPADTAFRRFVLWAVNPAR